MHALYTCLDIGTLAAAVGLGIRYRQPWLRQPVRTMVAIMASSLPFIIGDVLSVRANHWHFNPAYTFGISFFGLPLEEIGFFIVVPLASLALWQLIAARYHRPTQPDVLRRYTLIWMVVSILLLTVWHGRAYSVWVAACATVACLIALRLRRLAPAAWLPYNAVLLVLFFIFNSVLTALPVISYNPAAISGVHLGTIPIEDFLYNILLIHGVLIAYWAVGAARGPASQKM